MTLPRFLCIGAQKAGTSWLFAQLQSHPEVWMPPIKELQYFNHLYVPEHRAWTNWHIRQGAARALEYHVGARRGPRLRLRALPRRPRLARAVHRRLVPAGLRAAGGAGQARRRHHPGVFDDPRGRHPATCAALLGAVRIIYLIRAPVSRALSQLQMNVSRKGNRAPGRGAVARGGRPVGHRRTAATTPPTCRAGRRISPPRTCCSCPTAGSRHDPAGLMREVEAFLGLAPHDYPRLAERGAQDQELAVPERIVRRLADRLAPQAGVRPRPSSAPEFAGLT